MIFKTTNSTYEIDEEAKRIRRTSGVNEPTKRFIEDGRWHPYARTYSLEVGFAPVIDWGDGGATFMTEVIEIAD